MARGFDWCIYVDDLDRQWALQVDSDYAADADRGWNLLGELELEPFPRGWKPRRVVGVDDLGNTLYAIAGTTLAAIWTGAVMTFTFEASDGTTQTSAIIGRNAERRHPRPH
jgi:hypothetical protein